MRYGLPDLPPDSPPRPMKQILVYTGLRDGMQTGQQSFKHLKCPVSECELTASRSAASTAHLILWQNHLSLPGGVRPSGQIWMVSSLEYCHCSANIMTVLSKSFKARYVTSSDC